MENLKILIAVFILRTFSKIYGLAALRIGWGYGDKNIVNALNSIKPPFSINEDCTIMCN